jgi:hypothetical protein
MCVGYRKIKGYVLLEFHVMKPAMRTPIQCTRNYDFVIRMVIC